MWMAVVVLVASIVGWSASYFAVQWTGRSEVAVALRAGELRVSSWASLVDLGEYGEHSPLPRRGWQASPFRWPRIWRWRPTWLSASGVWLVSLPLWIPAAAAAVVLGVAWRGGRRARARAGRCEHCGYDLTGIVGACPECGFARRADRRGISLARSRFGMSGMSSGSRIALSVLVGVLLVIVGVVAWREAFWRSRSAGADARVLYHGGVYPSFEVLSDDVQLVPGEPRVLRLARLPEQDLTVTIVVDRRGLELAKARGLGLTMTCYREDRTSPIAEVEGSVASEWITTDAGDWVALWHPGFVEFRPARRAEYRFVLALSAADAEGPSPGDFELGARLEMYGGGLELP